MKQKMKKRVLCAVLAAIITAGAMGGCSMGQLVPSGESKADSSQTAESSKAETGSKTESVDTSERKGSTAWNNDLAAKKIGSVKKEVSSLNAYSTGCVYVDKNKKYGILSLDGKHDTGAKYYYADRANVDSGEQSTMTKGFFAVFEEERETDNPNVCGLVDSEGKEILPCKYGFISVLNDRYAQVITATEQTKDKDKALYYVTSKMLSLSPDEDDIMYAGKWEIYDIEKGKFVSGVTGTKRYNIDAKGSYLEYINDEGEKKIIDGSGSDVSDGRQIFTNGSYVLEKNGTATVYDTNDKKLFDFSTKDYSISDFRNCYFEATTGNYPDTKHFLLDESGKKVSVDFDETIYYIFPDYVCLNDYQVYSLDGKKLCGGKTLRFDDIHRDAYLAYDDDTCSVFDKDGNMHYSAAIDNDKYYQSSFAPYTTGSDALYYNYADKEFNIKGAGIGNWTVQQKEEKVATLFSTRSGKSILDNYYSYDSVEAVDGNEYILAYNSVNGSSSRGDYDIYILS